MKILIVYYSHSGHTKKVADKLLDGLSSTNDIQVKNALSVKREHIESADILLIGSPIHGYILFGQKFCSEVMKFVNETLPNNLQDRPVLLFATYLFFPRNALNKVEKIIKKKNGKVIGKSSAKRTNKEFLTLQIINTLNKTIKAI